MTELIAIIIREMPLILFVLYIDLIIAVQKNIPKAIPKPYKIHQNKSDCKVIYLLIQLLKKWILLNNFAKKSLNPFMAF